MRKHGFYSDVSRTQTACALVCLLLGARCACGVGFPAPVGGVLTLDVAEGEVATYDEALPDAEQLVKTGAGEARLTADTTAFTGRVDVRAGTLAITTLGALGENTKIEVTGDAATFHLDRPPRPSGAGQETKFFTGHDLTIRGKGVDGKGAFRYTALEEGADDSMLDSLTLTGDAFFAVPSRMGVSGPINLNGHTLTRVEGSPEWMLLTTTTIDAGRIVNQTGTLTVQHAPTFLAGGDKTQIVMEGGRLNFWDCPELLGCEVIVEGCDFQASAGGGERNIISGRVAVSNVLSVVTEQRHHALTFAGDFFVGAHVCKWGGGALYLDGPISCGDDNAWNQTLFNGGNGWIVMTTRVDRVIGAYGDGEDAAGSKCWLGDGTLYTQDMFRLGNGGGRSSFYQTGGVMRDEEGDTVFIGEHVNAVGNYVLAGGMLLASNRVQVGSCPTSTGILLQKGGRFEIAGDKDSGDLNLGGDYGSQNVMVHVAGGTNDTCQTNKGAARIRVSPNGGRVSLSVTGPGTLLRTAALEIGSWDPTVVSTNVLNLADGAVLEAERLYRLNTMPAGALVTASADGGVLKPIWPWGWCHLGADDENFFKRAFDHFTIHSGGLDGEEIGRAHV